MYVHSISSSMYICIFKINNSNEKCECHRFESVKRRRLGQSARNKQGKQWQKRLLNQYEAYTSSKNKI